MSELEQQVIQSKRMQAELESYGNVLIAINGLPFAHIGEVAWLDDTISPVVVVVTKKSSWEEWRRRGKRMPDFDELAMAGWWDLTSLEDFEIWEAVAE